LARKRLLLLLRLVRQLIQDGQNSKLAIHDAGAYDSAPETNLRERLIGEEVT
jgi:hypothetical protein